MSLMFGSLTFSYSLSRSFDDDGEELLEIRCLLFCFKNGKTNICLTYDANSPLSEWIVFVSALGGDKPAEILFCKEGVNHISYCGWNKTVTFACYGSGGRCDMNISVDYTVVEESLRAMVKELAGLINN